MLGIKTSHLSAEELADFEQCKKVVAACLNNYHMMGKALRKIHDKQYYRGTHESFEAFVLDEWKMTKQHAHRLMTASTLAELLEPTGYTPATENQARELSGLPPRLQVAAWEDAVTAAGGEQPTTQQIAAAVAPRKKSKRRRRPKPIRLKVPGGIVIVEPSSDEVGPLELLAAASAKLSARLAA